jgi:hypothetical protein
MTTALRFTIVPVTGMLSLSASQADGVETCRCQTFLDPVAFHQEKYQYKYHPFEKKECILLPMYLFFVYLWV